ncbi:amino acid ABC transporter permease [Enteractinococcus helveticum]|uniref:Amino acid ABC transporter permease n=1 Tax=Enteractinococcus helveticum TaxID=1837282 RepID=A0A1B7LYI2_9MICC|nr:amino acid ABC transporter permease [Enteractinococcus helveticum]OAV60287.1 amino acid ABC transporter permease [Enteractinococcus helveticum]
MSNQYVLFDAPGPRSRRIITVLNIVVALMIIGVLAWLYFALAAQGQMQPHLWWNAINLNAWTNYLIPGLTFTLQAAAIAVVTSVIFGLFFGFLRLAPIRILRWISMVIVEFFRAVPVLVLMVFLHFFISQYLSTVIDPRNSAYYAVIIALTLYNGAVIAELVRSGVRSLPAGQREAALAVGMTTTKSLRFVEVPQALVAMLPSLVSQFVIILKDSALGYIIGFAELLRYSRQLGAGYGNIMQALVVAAIIFIIINSILVWLAQMLSRRLSSRTSGLTEVGIPGVAPIAGDAAEEEFTETRAQAIIQQDKPK